jgi:hypothetical protein
LSYLCLTACVVEPDDGDAAPGDASVPDAAADAAGADVGDPGAPDTAADAPQDAPNPDVHCAIDTPIEAPCSPGPPAPLEFADTVWTTVSFSYPYAIPAAVGDFDGDGKADVYLRHEPGSQPPWQGFLTGFWGSADGRLVGGGTGHTAPFLLDPIAADLDRDGKLDLLIPAGDSTDIYRAPWRVLFLRGLGNRSFESPVTLFEASYPRLVGVRDLDGDGDHDVVTYERRLTDEPPYRDEAFVRSYRRSAAGPFERAADLELVGSSNSFALGNLDGDAHVDVVGLVGPGVPESGSLNVFAGAGDATFRAPTATIMPGAGLAVGVTDFAGDEREDIVAAVQSGLTSLAVKVITGGSQDDDGVSLFVRLMFVADMDADGRPEIVLGGYGKTEIMTAESTGDSQTLLLLEESDPDALVIGVGDFDGDGRPDLLYKTGSSSVGARNALGVRLNRTPPPPPCEPPVL